MKTRKILSLIVCAIMMFSIVGCTFLQDVESIEITKAPQIKYVLNADRAAALTAITVSVKMRGDATATIYKASNSLLTVENFKLSTVGSRTAVIYVTSSPLFKVYFDYQVVDGTAEDGFAGGTGVDADNAFIITNTQQFYNISKIEDIKTADTAKTFYKLANDIDFTFEGGNIALPMVVNADIDLGTFTIKGLKTHLVGFADTIKIHNGTIILGGNASIVSDGTLFGVTVTTDASGKKNLTGNNFISAFTFSNLNVFGDVMTSSIWYGVFNCYNTWINYYPHSANVKANFTFDNISSSVNISSTGANVGELIGYGFNSKIAITPNTIKLSNVIQAAHKIYLIGNNQTVFVGEATSASALADINGSTRKNPVEIPTGVKFANINDNIFFTSSDLTISKYIFQISVSVHKLVEGSYSGNYPRIIQKTVYVTNTDKIIDTGFKQLMVYEAKYDALGSQFTIPKGSTIDTTNTKFNLGFGIAKLTDSGVESDVYYYDDGVGATHRLLTGAPGAADGTIEVKDGKIQVTLSVFSYDVLGNLKGFGTFSYDPYKKPTVTP